MVNRFFLDEFMKLSRTEADKFKSIGYIICRRYPDIYGVSAILVLVIC